MATETITKANAKAPARAELLELEQRITEAEQVLAETRTEANEALADLGGLPAEEGRLWAAGKRREAEAVAKRRQEGEAERRTWQARMDGCVRALDQVKRDRQAFIEQRGDDLIAELAPQVDKATEAVYSAASELLAAIATFNGVQQALAGYVSPDRRRNGDPRLIEAAAVVERMLDPEARQPYATAPLGKLDPYPAGAGLHYGGGMGAEREGGLDIRDGMGRDARTLTVEPRPGFGRNAAA